MGERCSVLVERDCVADLVGRKMSGAMERRDAAFYAGRNAQAERARTETSVSPPYRTVRQSDKSEGRCAVCGGIKVAAARFSV